MRCSVLIFTGILSLAAPAGRAEVDGQSAGATPEEIAAKTMKAMEALDAPGAAPLKPAAEKVKDKKDLQDKGTKTAQDNALAKADKEDEDAASPAILPAAGPQQERGVDPMSRARMDLMIPAGRSHRGVHYPMYRPVEAERGEVDPLLGSVPGVVAPLASLFESDIVTRLDEDHVQFDRAKWVQYDTQPGAGGEAKPTMTLEIERGVYDLKNEILMTNQPVKIENQQFLITGDTMLHDRASGLTRLTGRVKMTFYNEEPDPAPNAPDPATAPSSAITPRQP